MPAANLASRKQCGRRHKAWRDFIRPSASVAHDGLPLCAHSLKSFSLLSTDDLNKPCPYLHTSLSRRSLAISKHDALLCNSHRSTTRVHFTQCSTCLHHASACSRHITRLQTSNNSTSGSSPQLYKEPDLASALQSSLQDCQYAYAYISEVGLTGDVYLINLALRAYSKLGTMSDARAVFDAMPRPSILSWNTMIGGYVNGNALDEAREFFDEMPQRNVVTWNSLITAYAHYGKSKSALHLFQRLYLESGLPNDVTFINVLSACSQLADLTTGRLVHILICGSGLESSLTVGTALINFYAKSNDLKSALDLFHRLGQHDVASWTSLISAYGHLAEGEVALHLYRQMQQEGIQPNKLTTQSILSAIANKLLLKEGKLIHACVCFSDLGLNADIASALINMYGKCGSIKYAWLVFKDVNSIVTSVWNAMIAACIEQSCYWQALSFYYQGLWKGVKLDKVSFANSLFACVFVCLSTGMLIHAHLIEVGDVLDVVVSNTLVTLYSRCDALEDAIAVFEKMQFHNVVTWTCMIAAYGQEGLYQKAFELLQQMQLQHVKPNDVTVATALVSCADSIALEEGRLLHAWVSLERNQLNSAVTSGIINMYGKCGALADAFSVFKSSDELGNTVLWNAMINGFAYGGHGEAALVCFFRMQRERIEPDELTFVGVLSACSHAGMVNQGLCCYYYLAGGQHKRLLLEHCVCIVDIFARAGQLTEAQSFVHKVPFLPDACLWSALQAVNRMHGDSVCGKWTSEHNLEFG
ncbi:hypothetical protein L7F22_017581 [Adiantum nelumboides]|nr:hypothetical protein [Adiantum nelumboides]